MITYCFFGSFPFAGMPLTDLGGALQGLTLPYPSQGTYVLFSCLSA